MKTIMRDIAKLAGVSPGTVSNALNNRKGVGKETKEKVLKIAKELGYIKEDNKQESRVIRFIIYKKHGYVVSDTPFFAELIEGIETACRNESYELLISHISGSKNSSKDVEKIIKQEKVAGILILATEMDKSDLDLFRNLHVPIVFLDNYLSDEKFDFVLINNSKGAYQAVRHLINNGHKEIGFLGSSIHINNFSYRYEGYIKALAEANLDNKKEYELSLEPTLEGSYRDMKELILNKDIKLPTAYFALNDIIAFGAMKALRECGIKVPDQVSIVGFDDMPFCEISTPRLATVRVYKQYMGQIAIDRLIECISKKHNIPIKIEVETELVARESVKNINK